jgi:hypothetical protein
MTRIRVTPDGLAALAGALAGVADELAWCSRRADTDAWSLGPGDTPSALAEVLGDFEHQRLLLGRSCEALASAVRTAGSAYAEVDTAVTPDVEGSAGTGVGAAADRGADDDTGVRTVAGTGTGIGAGAEVAAGGSGGAW